MAGKELSVEDLLGYKLRRASVAANTTLNERLAKHGLRVTEATILLQIAKNPGTTLSQLGRDLAIKRANVTPSIARLSDRGFVASERQDGRSQSLHLTESGWEIHNKIYKLMHSHQEEFFAALNESEMQVLHTLLSKICVTKGKS